MGIVVYKKNGIIVTIFYGGKDRGRMAAIHLMSDPLELTEKQFDEFIEALYMQKIEVEQ